MRLLKAAHLAPSVGLMQPWRFVRITEPQRRRRIHALVQTERDATAEALNERQMEFLRLKVEGILECGVLLDGLLGEPRHWHPLVGFGRLANRAEQVCCGAANLDPRARHIRFVCAQPELLARLNALLGPWTLCSAARWVASAALKDHLWQESTRLRLLEDGARLHALLSENGLAPDGGCPLFQWSRTPLAVELHQHFAGLGILTRLFVEPCSLRLGVPGNEADWQRLGAALTQVTGSNRAELDR